VGKPEGKSPIGKPGRREDDIKVDRRWRMRAWAGNISHGMGTVGGCCAHGDEPEGTIKNVENFLTS
jgi:hypothetical protein